MREVRGRFLVLLWAIALGFAPRPAGIARASPPTKPAAAARSSLLDALEQEMRRSVDGYKSADPAPYFISYGVADREWVQVSSTNGALRAETRNRSRLLDVDVRVGGYELDNTRRLRGDRGFGGIAGFRAVRLPIEDDVLALRQPIWLETDRRYRDASEAFIQVKTNTELKTKESDVAADFSREGAEHSIAPILKLTVDTSEWRRRLKEVSRVFEADPRIYRSDATLSAELETRFFVSSEGTVVQESAIHGRVSLFAQTKAEDGMDLYRFETFDAHTPDRLPDERTLKTTAERLLKEVLLLRDAPTIEPYTGPAILSGRAAGVFFHEIFGHRIEGHRQKGDEEGQTFTKKVNQAILPDFLSVYDDPTREQAGGIDLNGFYRHDDEGVAARPVTVVDKGILKTFLMSRTPVPGFDRSNGHGRKQPGRRAVGRQGNLIVESASGVSEEKLREMLREQSRKEGKPFGLYFAEISGGFTFTGRGIPQSFQVRPVMVYRVYADGRPDELVRGADLIGTPLVSFSKILATGQTPAVFNGLCGAESGIVPVAAIAPSVLTGQIEIQKQEKSPDRPPLLPPPGARP